MSKIKRDGMVRSCAGLHSCAKDLREAAAAAAESADFTSQMTAAWLQRMAEKIEGHTIYIETVLAEASDA